MELSPGSGADGILAGVTAFVDVWSSNRTENYSKMFSKQLLNLGAKVSKTFNKQVTHVIFKDGSQSTWDKAVKSKVKLVSVLWVEKCRETVMHVEESVYPAINTNTDLPQLNKKKRKCMQPKDFVERTPESDKRFARKFDKMCKDLDVQKDNPRLSYDTNDDEDYWTVLYSPKAVIADRCNAMEKRIQDMKNKRENLSPTASQMSQPFDFSSLKPSPGNSPSVMADSPHENDIGSLNTSYDDLFESVLKGGCVPSTPSSDVTESTGISSKFNLSTPKIEGDKSSLDRAKSQTGTQTRRRKSNRLKLFNGRDVDGGSTPLTMKETVDIDSISLKNKTVTKLNLDAVDRETKNLTQISHKDQKTNVKAALSATDSDSGSDAFYETTSKKDRVSGLEYSSMANRLIAKCKEKQSKKTGRCSLKYEVPVCYAKNKAVKVEAKSGLSSCTTDTDDGFSNFEDFFSSTDLTKQLSKHSRFSLTLEPRSPSPPPLTPNVKDCRQQRSVGAAPQATYSAKKRKYSATYSDSSPLENYDSKKPHINSRKSVASTAKQSPVTSEPETSIGLKKSEVAENGVKESPVMCEKMQENLYLTNGTDNGKQMKPFQLSIESKTSASDAIGGLSEMFNEQRNKCTVESRKTEKGRKITRSLVMTSMSSEKQSTIMQVVKKFGSFVFSNEVCETTTHVITGSPRRTLNVILGIARGCWILSYDWVLWSLECGHWIPEEPYELSNDFPGAPICRLQRHLSAGEYHQDLFSSVPSIFISPNTQPPYDKLSDVVQLCGGKVCKTLRSAKVCIGMFAGKKPPDLECVSEKWLLDSITQHKLLPLQNYLLEQ